MRLVALRAIALVASATVNAPSLADDAPANSAAMSHSREYRVEGGPAIFRNVCAACHRPDAKGAVGAGAYPPLTADKKLVSTGFMLTVLFRGLNGMPPVGDMMSDAQVADVINYVRTHFGNAYPDAIS